MRAHFGGIFECERLPWFDAGLLNEIEVTRMAALLSNHFSALKQCTYDLSEMDCADPFIAKVITGGVPGMYTEMESIIMLGENQKVWAAYINEESVMYFTNDADWKTQLPRTIEEWRVNFVDKVVTFSSA